MLFIDLLVVFLGIVVRADAQKCYYPDGSVASNDSPCHSASISDGASACCDPVDMCLNNGLCLAQWGGEVISRGSCTDQSWQSTECSQYCADDHPSGGAPIHLIHYFQNQPVFCCGSGFANNNTCSKPTKGSAAPFFIEAGLVIFNRTFGSTSPNGTDTTLGTVTATATTAGPVSASSTLSTTRASLSPSSPPSPPSPLSSSSSSASSSSSRTGTAVGAGVSGALALLLLATLGLLLREKKHKKSFKKDAETWKVRYADMVQSHNILVDNTEVEHKPPQLFHSWNPSELHGESQLPHQLDGWNPSELHGKQRLPNEIES